MFFSNDCRNPCNHRGFGVLTDGFSNDRCAVPCHRKSCTDKLHEALNALLPGALLIGFTGTPLLEKDKKKRIEVFGLYIRAEESEKVSAFDDMSLVELIVERGEAACDQLPKGLKENADAMAETIENNVRKVIIDEIAVDPKYYEKMSDLLDELILARKKLALDY